MKKALALLFCVTFIVTGAHAETVPPQVLDKDFIACMAGKDPQKDPERNEKCGCIRDSMKNWSLEAYQKIAADEAKGEQTPVELQEVVKTCIAKVSGMSN